MTSEANHRNLSNPSSPEATAGRDRPVFLFKNRRLEPTAGVPLAALADKPQGYLLALRDGASRISKIELRPDEVSARNAARSMQEDGHTVLIAEAIGRVGDSVFYETIDKVGEPEPEPDAPWLEYARITQTWSVPVPGLTHPLAAVEHLLLKRSGEATEAFQRHIYTDAEAVCLNKMLPGIDLDAFDMLTGKTVNASSVVNGVNFNPAGVACTFNVLEHDRVQLVADEPLYKELRPNTPGADAHVAFVAELDSTRWIEKKAWPTAYKNSLPDSAFLYIAPGGKKSGGRTSPKSLRYFPVRDADGKLDIAHLRNALARIPHSKAPGLDDAKKGSLQARARRLLAEAGDKPQVSKSYDVRYLHKAAEVEERFVLGIVLEPEVEDSQGDIYSAEEIRKTAHRYMEFYRQNSVMHEEMVGEESIRILESYIAPIDFDIEGEHVKAGSWLLGARIVRDDLWAKVKNGEFTGWSMGGWGTRTPEQAAA